MGDNPVINGEMIRGHIDTIILLSLTDGDKDSNEIRADIESRSENKYSVKQGTFYSAMQRLESQGYIHSYRSSSEDGIRRKFFTLDEKGRRSLDKNKEDWLKSKELIDNLIDAPDVPKKEKPFEEEEKDEFDDLSEISSSIDGFDISEEDSDEYFDKLGKEALESLNSEMNETETADGEIPEDDLVYEETEEEKTEDTTSLSTENPDDDLNYIFEEIVDDSTGVSYISESEPAEKLSVSEENTEDFEEIEEEPVAEIVEEEKPVEREKDDFLKVDSGQPTNRREYKSILTKLFPKNETQSGGSRISADDNKQIDFEELNETENTQTEKTYKKQSSGDAVDFSDLYAMANREGFKLKTSVGTNKKVGERIFLNKLRCHASALWYLIAFVEMLILNLSLGNFVGWLPSVRIAVALSVAIFPIVMFAVYLRGRKNTVLDVPTFKDSVEVALIITFQLLIITLCVALFASIDFNNLTEVVSFIVLPMALIIDIPLYIIIKYALLGTGNYTSEE